jgi:uncharacterized phage protein (TIGR01671 family)
MREIKFRVWDKEENYFNSDYSINGGYVYGYCEGKQLTTKEQEKLVFQQYTGLKDKNGKEIYEGDIISDNKTLKTTELGFISCEVIYEKELACFSVVTLSANKKERYIIPIHALELDIIPNKYEVISNIFENTELIK